MIDLKKRIVAGSLWSLIGSGTQQLFSVILFIYIARRLSPADIGLVALAMIFVDILSFVARCGQVEVIQRQRELLDRAISTSFWMLVAFGLVVTALIAAGGTILIIVFDRNQFGKVLILLAPIAILLSLSAVPEAILRRRFDYRSLTIRGWIGTFIGGGAGGYLAYRGFGIYSIIAQRVITAAVQTIASWALLGWHPKREFDRLEAVRLARAGNEIMAAGFTGLLNQRIAEGMTGFGLGAHELGLLRLASRLLDFITQLTVLPVSRVALSAFSELQHDVPAIRRAYLRMSQLMALVSFPMFFGLAAVADVFVPLVLGPKWAGAVIVIKYLTVTRLAAPVNYFFGPAMIAIGKTRVVLRQSIAQVLMTIVLIGIGSLFGILGVLIAIAIRTTLIALYNIYSLRKEIGLEILPVLEVFCAPVVGCAVMIISVNLAMASINQLVDDPWLLVALIATGVITYVATLLLGDLAGLWRGYIRGVVTSVSRVVP